MVSVVVLVVEKLPRSSVGVMEVEAYEGRNDFDIFTDVVLEVAVVFGFID